MVHVTRYPTDTPERLAAAEQAAAIQLALGEIVVLPTETVYGLAANALNAEAVSRVFDMKGRPNTNPLIVHVVGWSMLHQCVRVWPEVADRLARAFWPGPLTLVLPRSECIPGVVTAGLDTVAVRWPSHPCMQGVIKRCGFPLAAPSANLANRLSPTTADHVLSQLGDRIGWIVDGGPCSVGIESTVVDLTGETPVILRPGVIHRESIQGVCGMPEIGLREIWVEEEACEGMASPGQFKKHYSPTSPLSVLSYKSETALRQQLLTLGADPGRVCLLCHDILPSSDAFLRVSVVPHDPEAYARALYAELHACDTLRPEHIIVEALPSDVAWEGARDRLARAASDW